MAKRKQMLEKHQYEVWQGNDGAWYTYFPDKEKVRKLKRRKSKKWNDERYECGERKDASSQVFNDNEVELDY